MKGFKLISLSYVNIFVYFTFAAAFFKGSIIFIILPCNKLPNWIPQMVKCIILHLPRWPKINLLPPHVNISIFKALKFSPIIYIYLYLKIQNFLSHHIKLFFIRRFTIILFVLYFTKCHNWYPFQNRLIFQLLKGI